MLHNTKFYSIIIHIHKHVYVYMYIICICESKLVSTTTTICCMLTEFANLFANFLHPSYWVIHHQPLLTYVNTYMALISLTLSLSHSPSHSLSLSISLSLSFSLGLRVCVFKISGSIHACMEYRHRCFIIPT